MLYSIEIIKVVVDRLSAQATDITLVDRFETPSVMVSNRWPSLI